MFMSPVNVGESTGGPTGVVNDFARLHRVWVLPLPGVLGTAQTAQGS